MDGPNEGQIDLGIADEEEEKEEDYPTSKLGHYRSETRNTNAYQKVPNDKDDMYNDDPLIYESDPEVKGGQVHAAPARDTVQTKGINPNDKSSEKSKTDGTQPQKNATKDKSGQAHAAPAKDTAQIKEINPNDKSSEESKTDGTQPQKNATEAKSGQAHAAPAKDAEQTKDTASEARSVRNEKKLNRKRTVKRVRIPTYGLPYEQCFEFRNGLKRSDPNISDKKIDYYMRMFAHVTMSTE
ncbi:hypothetical protein GPJ56_006083 [Histomonas meleagridis]|uniref:uncharacterized protein n=1 Tax=Histomonas meleagridis TaxID=135588 RepID=UPI00355A1C8F|nr:hypothetical protein GPJ56_006083 [Histomonas meleagridis]KAH0807191.1 hypothetical protein GO595_000367 [Histomonas meleagridis]